MLKSLMTAWLILVGALYVTATVYMAGHLQLSKRAAQQEHRARLDPTADESGRTVIDTRALDGSASEGRIEVTAGIYVDRIPKLSMPDTTWEVDFYLWFTWSDPGIDPGANFHVINGEILKRELLTRVAAGETQYALFRVKAEITKFFNVSRFPLDDHLLALRIEDAQYHIGEMIYIADVAGSAVSSRVRIPGYDIYDSTLVQKPHSYKTRRGDPRLGEDHQATYAQLVYGIAIREPGWALYVKMFLGTFASVAISLLAFLVGPGQTGARFSIGIGAFFAAVASTYVVSRLIPQTGTVGLTDFVMAASLVTIFLNVLTSTMAARAAEITEDARLLRRFDLAALAVFLTGFTVLNVVIANTALL